MVASTVRMAAAGDDVVAKREAKSRTRHLCKSCQDRKSLFRYRGAVRADDDHTLCFQCFRSLRDHMRARAMAA